MALEPRRSVGPNGIRPGLQGNGVRPWPNAVVCRRGQPRWPTRAERRSALPRMTRPDYWLTKFANLRIDCARGDPAPHKPLLLLVICDLAEQGGLPQVLPLSPDLAFRFHTYWSKQVAQTCFPRSAAFFTDRSQGPRAYKTGPRYSLPLGEGKGLIPIPLAFDGTLTRRPRTSVLVPFGVGSLSNPRSFPRKRESTWSSAHFGRFAE